ncbi:hypothetical protein BDR07DRAFT_1416500 [Suillus spraguei]|nr:hypothetical protein BDR07DRAFT_1434548 [Suillus spraguei]KAG2358856.1 hypothetical protein BDR07DRAFT_1416500 [Suillus spraguei]
MSLSCYQHWIEPQIESPFARVKSSYLPNSEDPGLQERVQKCIPSHLSYSLS